MLTLSWKRRDKAKQPGAISRDEEQNKVEKVEGTPTEVFSGTKQIRLHKKGVKEEVWQQAIGKSGTVMPAQRACWWVPGVVDATFGHIHGFVLEVCLLVSTVRCSVPYTNFIHPRWFFLFVNLYCFRHWSHCWRHGKALLSAFMACVLVSAAPVFWGVCPKNSVPQS